MNPAFFVLHRDLVREGPGDRDALDWALSVAGTEADARILDAGCGPGADIEGLLAHAPQGHVTAIDAHPPFIDQVRRVHGADPRVTALAGDMAAPGGPYDLIWSAGALYFLGIEVGLTGWRAVLKPGGVVAFSEPVYFSEAPSEGARAFWDGHPVKTEAGIREAVLAAGYRVLATRPLPDAAWEAYYGPLDLRIATLRGAGPDADLAAVLDEAEREAALWRAHRHETGYLQVVARRA